MATHADTTTAGTLAGMDDDTLDAMRVAILTEQERRARCAQLPAQLEDMARAALEAGLGAETVRGAVETALEDGAK